MPPRTTPVELDRPPTTAATNPLRAIIVPIAPPAYVMGATTTPAIAQMPPARAKVSATMRAVSMPTSFAATRLLSVALTYLPRREKSKKSLRTTTVAKRKPDYPEALPLNDSARKGDGVARGEGGKSDVFLPPYDSHGILHDDGDGDRTDNDGQLRKL